MTPFFSTRWIWRAAAVSLVIVTAACGQQGPSPEQSAQIAADVTSRWAKAFDAADPAALAALYAEDARSMPPGAALEGRTAIEQYWRADMGEGGATTKFTVGNAMIDGDLLHVEGTYEVAGEGGAALINGQFQQLWRRANNDWQVLREMWRMDPAMVRSIEVAERLTSEWTRAYNAGDAKALAGLYSKDAVLSTVQDGSFAGQMAIGSFWERDFGGGKPSSTLELSDVYASGELAHLEGEYKVTDRGTVTEGRFVQLWMREGNAWRVHREMWLR